MSPRVVVVFSLALLACDRIGPPPAPVCRAPDASTPAVSAEVVCARLAGLSCAIPDCAEAYARYRRATSAGEFDRLVGCYSAAQTCDEVDQCAYACGQDGGAIALRAPTDAATDAATDASTEDAADSATEDVTQDAPEDAPKDASVTAQDAAVEELSDAAAAGDGGDA